MKAKAIQREWASHMYNLVLLGQDEPVAEDEPIAMLFGLDEIRVDIAKRTIKLPGFGKMPFDGDVSQLAFEWVAVYQSNGEWVVSFGAGSPFGAEAAKVLPTKNGVVCAVPAALA